MSPTPETDNAASRYTVVVLFDGRCGLCQNSRRWCARIDWLGAVEWVNFRDPLVRAAIPQLTDDQLEQEMWVVSADGLMRPGFSGWRHLLKSFPLTFLAALLLFVPPLPWLGRRVYAFIARRRRLRCEITTPPAPPTGPWRTILRHARPATAQ